MWPLRIARATIFVNFTVGGGGGNEMFLQQPSFRSNMGAEPTSFWRCSNTRSSACSHQETSFGVWDVFNDNDAIMFISVSAWHCKCLRWVILKLAYIWISLFQTSQHLEISVRTYIFVSDLTGQPNRIKSSGSAHQNIDILVSVDSRKCKLSRNAFKLKIGQVISEIQPVQFSSIFITSYWWIRYFLGIISAYFWLKLTNIWWKILEKIRNYYPPPKRCKKLLFYFLYIHFHIKFCTEMRWNLTEKSYWKFQILTEKYRLWAKSYWMHFSNVGRSAVLGIISVLGMNCTSFDSTAIQSQVSSQDLDWFHNWQ